MARSDEEKKIYKKEYPLAVGAYDLYILFLLLSKQISNNVFCWIIPNKFLIAEYAKKTMQILIDSGLQYSLDVSTFDVFKNASVYPIVILGSKKNKSSFMEYGLNQYEDLLRGKIIPQKKLTAKKTIESSNIKVCAGATGFEAQHLKGFVINGEQVDSIPFTVSGNIDRYHYDNINVRYMKSKYERAFIRLDSSIASSKIAIWKHPKIVIAGMTKCIESTYVDTPLALGVGAYAIYDFGKFSPLFIVGVLNAKYTSYYLKTVFKDKHLAGGYLAINKSTIERLPFPSASKEKQQTIASFVEIILAKKKSNPQADTSDLEHEIDQLVYQLYGLTDDEIAIVENS